MRTWLALLLSVLLLIVPPAHAKKPTGDEAAVRVVHERMFGAMTAGDFVGSASDMHPDALREFRGMLAPLLELAEQDGESIPFLPSPSDARSMSDLAFYQAFMQLMGGMMGATMKGASARVLGVVFDGPDSAYVVYELTVRQEELEVKKVAVTPFRRVEGERWGALLTGEMSGMAKMMQRMAAEKAKAGAAAE